MSKVLSDIVFALIRRSPKFWVRLNASKGGLSFSKWDYCKCIPVLEESLLNVSFTSMLGVLSTEY